MSDQQPNPIRQAIADAIEQNEVLLFMKGTPDAPACGFSMRTVAALKAYQQQHNLKATGKVDAATYKALGG